MGHKGSFVRAGFLRLAGALMILVACQTIALADITINIYQNGANVEADATGTVNLSGLTTSQTGGAGFDAILASQSVIGFGPTNILDTFYKGLSGPSDFGTGGIFFASTSSGSVVALDNQSGVVLLDVPTTTVQGDSVNSTDYWDNSTLSGLGLTLGTYDFGTSGDADQVVVIISAQAPAVAPEPETLTLMLSGLVFLVVGFSRRSIGLP